MRSGTPASQPPASAKESEKIPEELILATKSAVDMGASFEKRKLLPCNGRSYPAAAVLAAIEELKNAEGGVEDIGARRKSKHCVPRFCEMVAMNLDKWFRHRTQLSKAELHNKLTGKTRPAMVELWEEFKDRKVLVRYSACRSKPNITFDKFTTMKNEIIKDLGDMYVNVNKSGHHEEMYSFCKGLCVFRSLFGVLPCPPGSEFTGTGKRLPTQESPESKTIMSLWLSFVLTQLKLEKHLRLQARTSSPRPPSHHDYPALTALRNTPGSLDTYYYGLMCERYPGIEQASSQMLPEGTENENTGVGGVADEPTGAEGAAADASRRAGAKWDSTERDATLGVQEKKKKKEKEIEDAAKVVASAATEELGLGAGLASLLGMPSSPKYSDAPTSFYDTIEGCETRNKKLEYSARLRQTLADIKEDIRKEKARGSEQLS
ncbi:unnamed protein product [Ectocarpus sp. CCAP 1310/34]|nr:unnamed protein product [Ectocarpus sp. CCAP 1310/34]